MTTGRRALVRAGVVMALAAGGLLAVGSPAYADNVGVTVDSHFVPFNPGDTQPLKITVAGGGASSVTVSVSGLSNFTAGHAQGCDRSSGSSCTVAFGPGDTSKVISFTITATGNVGPGQSRTDHGTVSARQNALLGGSATAGFDVTLQGLRQTQTVAQISGVVRDMTTGSPIPNAVVVLVDAGACASGGNPCQVGTDSSGVFTFAPTPDRPITPGTLQIRATKSGYAEATLSVVGRAGQPITVSLALKPTAAAGASASPGALPGAEGSQPTADAVTATAAGIAPATAPTPAGDSRPSALSWTVLVLAGLLVVAGVGVLAVMFLHRRTGAVDGNPPLGPGDGATAVGSWVDHAADDGADPTTLGSPEMSNAVAAPGGSDATAIIRPRRPADDLPGAYPAADLAGLQSDSQAGSVYGAPVDPDATRTDGYGSGQPTGYAPATHGYGGAHGAYGQGGDYGADAGHGGPRAAYGADHRYGSGGAAHDGTWPWYDGADGGYAGGGDCLQQGDDEGGYGQQDGGWAGQDHGYPWDEHGASDPPQQPHPTETPPGRDTPQAGHGGDRQRVDWFGN